MFLTLLTFTTLTFSTPSPIPHGTRPPVASCSVKPKESPHATSTPTTQPTSTPSATVSPSVTPSPTGSETPSPIPVETSEPSGTPTVVPTQEPIIRTDISDGKSDGRVDPKSCTLVDCSGNRPQVLGTSRQLPTTGANPLYSVLAVIPLTIGMMLRKAAKNVR